MSFMIGDPARTVEIYLWRGGSAPRNDLLRALLTRTDAVIEGRPYGVGVGDRRTERKRQDFLSVPPSPRHQYNVRQVPSGLAKATRDRGQIKNGVQRVGLLARVVVGPFRRSSKRREIKPKRQVEITNRDVRVA